VADLLARYRPSIERAVQDALPEDGPAAELLGYPLGLVEADGSIGPGIGGKLLRPSLTCFACEAAGGEPASALPLAVALELVHNFSLVHDDIQDGDPLRRGRPTVWQAFGVPQAINTGDAMLVVALETALGAALDGEQRLSCLAALLRGTRIMIEGQVMDLELQKAERGEPEAYLEMAHRKTGALIGCALELGARAAGRSELAAPHRRLGECLGLAFQIRDDILGVWGDPEQTGKPAATGSAGGQHTLPWVLATGARPEIAARLGEASPAEFRAALEEVGARQATERILAQSLEEAGQHLHGLPWPAWARAAIEDLMHYLACREA